MNSIYLQYSMYFIAGLLTGLFYFGTLWMIISRFKELKKPYLVLISGYFLRTATALAVFYLSAVLGGLRPLLICLGGFIVIKIVMTFRKSSPPPVMRKLTEKEV